jgi:diguanylate cyclase (GGDEF)-like protein
MPKILIVDDNAMNRKLLASLLHHEGYETIEAVDGKDALAALRAGKPQLVMSDILMPTMDGYEFVRQLRADAEFGETPVIFHTAHYHEREAQRLAEVCGVARVLAKPSEAAEILLAVERALTGTADLITQPLAEDFDRQHLQLVTDKLSQHAAQLRAANTRFAALIELNVQLASERDPRVLLEKVCHAARNLMGAKYAVLALAAAAEGGVALFATSGLDLEGNPAQRPDIDAGALGEVCAQRRSLRIFNKHAPRTDIGLPDCYPPARAFLAAPLCSLTRTYGWLCLADKLGAEGFSAEDERIITTLGAQVGRIYENGSLYREVEQHAAKLLVEMEKREAATARIQHLNRVYAVLSGINSLIVRVQDRGQLLDEACRLAVESGQFGFAWCGWLDCATGQLHRAAWAGNSDHLAQLLHDSIGEGSTTPTLIGAAIASQQPQFCNDIDSDPRAEYCRHDLRAHGYQAIVALPLAIAGKPAGCLVLATTERGFFDAQEMNLLLELAGDISFALDHIEKAERLNYLAYYDVLTGLANRTFFHERLSIHVNTATRGERQLALVVAQIERFDSVADSLGRHAADQLLRELAERFSRCVGDVAAVARVGPDQFAAFIPDIERESDVVQTIEGWWPKWLSAPFVVEGNELRLSANAGIALSPVDGNDADILLKNAEAALKRAKSTGDRYLFYTRHLTERGAEKLGLESRLRRALENEEFVLHYQPKVDLETRRLKGVEALIRWQDPVAGLVPPGEFIPLMEETGLIADVGTWVLQQACLDRSRWLEKGLNAPRVAVNVSTLQLRRSDFVRTVKNILRVAGSEAGIDIEVTESLIMQDVADNIAKLEAIRALGVRIAIDDFGTGYSSLGYLAKLPVEILKIDRSFVTAMLDDPSAMTLVSTIISLAHALRLEVVAEGVESEEQAKILRLVRCDQMQGYLISKPLSFADMNMYLARSRPQELA